MCFEILETAWLQIADFSIQGTLPVSQASAVETGAPKQPVEPFTPGKTRLTSLKMTLKIHQFSESVKLSTVFFAKECFADVKETIFLFLRSPKLKLLEWRCPKSTLTSKLLQIKWYIQ